MNNLSIYNKRKELGLTQSELAEKLFVSYRTIQNWEKGGVIPKSKHEILSRIFEDIENENKSNTKNEEKTNHYSTSEETNHNINEHLTEYYKERKQNKVSIYDIEVFASNKEFDKNKEYKPIAHVSFPNISNVDGGVYVNGDSMMPTINSGDIIMLYNTPPTIENIFFGEIYLIGLNLNGKIYARVCRIKKSNLGDEYITLDNDNKAYDSKDVHISSVKTLSLVKSIIKVINLK